LTITSSRLRLTRTTCSLIQQYSFIQRRDKNIHTATGFVHVAVRMFSLCQRKIDGGKKKNDQMPTTLVNNCVAFIFDEIRFDELNGEIDCNREHN